MSGNYWYSRKDEEVADREGVLSVMDDHIGVIHPSRSPEEAAWHNRVVKTRAAVAELIEAFDELVTHTIGCEILLKVHETETVAKAKAALRRVKGEGA